MKTECNKKRYTFQALGRREILSDFNGGTIASDADGILLREVEKRTGILSRFARCFTNYRRKVGVRHQRYEQLGAPQKKFEPDALN